MKEYNMNIRCYYGNEPGAKWTQHRRKMKLKDMGKWIEAYQLTHPDVTAITIKIYMEEERNNGNSMAMGC